jgi:hypothetical protein
MTFNYSEHPESTEIYLGTIDEDTLLGEKAGEEYHGTHGTKSTRKPGGLGNILARTDRSSHIWFENAIDGLQDHLPGVKYWRERTDGTGFESPDELKGVVRSNSLS